MIPKVIHYCWFGKKEKPALARRCIRSWHKLLPDYSFIEWNEDNFPISSFPYAKYCLKEKKYAFLTDYIRLYVIYEYGGIYFDTDVELLKRPDELLKYPAFFGFENNTYINTGLGFGADKGNAAVASMLQYYLDLRANGQGKFHVAPCPKINTEALIPLGLKQDGKMQFLRDVVILPSDYLNPYDDPTGVLKVTENTISIHWFGKSWMKKSSIVRSKFMKPLHRWFGVDAFKRFRR